MSDQSGSMNEGRICKCCDAFKPWASFDKKKNGVNGHHSQCKDCVSQIKLEWRKKKMKKKIQRPTILEFSKSDLTEAVVPFHANELAEFEKVLRSLVFDSVIRSQKDRRE